MSKYQKGSGEPTTRTNECVNNLTPDTDRKNAVSNDRSAQNYADEPTTGNAARSMALSFSDDFIPDWEAINKGNFLPPEFIEFTKQIRQIHDWLDVYSFIRYDFYGDISESFDLIEGELVECAEQISKLVAFEFHQTFFWGDPYCISKAKYDKKKAVETLKTA